MKSPTETQPFWADEQDNYQLPKFTLGALKTMKGIIVTYGILIMVFVFVSMFALIYKFVYPIVAWLFLLYIGVSLGFGIYRRRQNRLFKQEIASIQEKAKSRIGAAEIGSAIHVAGHPLLDREQPIVLALIEGKGLCFYKYDNDHPLDILPVEEIISIHTVVYDDERTPHIDAVDRAAQALQIVFKREGKEYTTLLRSMKKLRPIDWYHALQKSRARQ